MSYRISIAPQLPGSAVYNPFEILGISSSLDERAIKKHYKKLSLQLYVLGHIVLIIIIIIICRTHRLTSCLYLWEGADR